jgi:hypothetical protein
LPEPANGYSSDEQLLLTKKRVWFTLSRGKNSRSKRENVEVKRPSPLGRETAAFL